MQTGPLKNIITTKKSLLRHVHTLSLCLSLPPTAPPHPSASFLLPPVRKLICSLLGELLTFSICEKHFSSPYTLWLTHTHTPTRVCALLTELFHFRLSNNPATTCLHVLDMHARWDAERGEDAARVQSASINELSSKCL